MKIEITGNPGTGNTFNETNIGYVENYNPNATTVIVNHYDGKKKGQTPEEKGQEELQKLSIKKDIKDYVGNLSGYVSDVWKNRYNTLWETILAHPKVSEVVYNPGKQQATFNRNLVANIICMMVDKGIITEDNKTTLTIALEGDKDSPVRAQLAIKVQDAEIKQAVTDVIEKFPA